MKEILLIEDDRALSNGICLAIKTEGIVVNPCFDLANARELQESRNYDLLILDINLPDGNGLDFLSEVRKSQDIPVIILTANDMETDIVAGLELGADDYITKPFSLAVLRARVNAQLRRGVSSNMVKVHDYIFDFDKMEFSKNNTSLELSRTEQKLLRCLVENRGTVLQRDTLMDRVWSDGADYVDENALSVTVKRLRNKLEDNPTKPRYIKTIYGVGYTWAVEQ